ncbi:MAG: helix-turn-helix transcriptional regulator [Ruminiclostridium sp.]|nr:helix-turn-helix transcriptional regulator [Ruminiclostridium sp.]
MNIDSIGKYIREYRKKKNMSQETLAELIDVSVPYISMLENSQKYPALDTLISLANALDISPNHLLCETMNNEYEMKRSVMLDEISELPEREQERIFTVVRAMIEEAKR